MKLFVCSAMRLSLTLFFSCWPCCFFPPALNLLSPFGLPPFLPFIVIRPLRCDDMRCGGATAQGG